MDVATDLEPAITSHEPPNMESPAILTSEQPILTEIYAYTPIQGSDSIRVLKLSPGQGNAALIGELVVVPLDESTHHEALSYVWGDPTRSEIMTCNGKMLPITRSLKLGLQAIRSSVGTITLWADQVCINQDDLAERSQQVQFMHRIYKTSDHVRVWLGTDEYQEAVTAFNFMKVLDLALEDGMEHVYDEDWKALRRFLSISWFERVWVCQEIGTAVPASLYWGTAVIDWITVTNTSNTFRDGKHWKIRRDLIKAPAVARPYYLYERFEEGAMDSRPRSFLSELHKGRSQRLRATDLATTSSPASDISLRYPRLQAALLFKLITQRQSCRSTMTLLSRSSRKLARLNCCILFSTKGRIIEITEDCPSWVPRWDYLRGRKNNLGDELSPLRATRGIPLDLNMTSPYSITLGGLEVDHITSKSKMPASLVSFEAAGLDQQNLIVRLWSDLTEARPTPNGKRVTPPDEIFGAASPFGVDLGQLRGDASHEDADMWAREVRTWCRRCNMYRTSKGYFVLGPHLAREGDNICVLFGGKTLYCLRKIDDHYTFIGECYAYGLVNGEAVDLMEKGELERKSFILR
ncbi:hypothetical protein Vi05172_g3163 [Venturia inaequalis]|nr:hypothetical protein Vi05172_g3163 [Venturia inaequalis]